ncbi:DinB family protein [Streptomyces graminilatus]|uniref:DinB family protein n=1 Tax=Streptomyces graminilatus TaxID=1464070 RepID=UPI00099E79A9|nr:DinB family protein [Streptomyces graminilatus]
MSTTPDGRPIPPAHADERAMLSAWLDFHRATLTLKCEGLDDRQARLASAAPSEMTLLGLVQHLAEVERNWFQRVFAGLDVPPLHPEGKGTGFTLLPGHGLDEALGVWRAEVARSRELVAAAASLDESGRLPEELVAVVGAEGLSLRWIMVHMIEEYARHNGHADLLRELVDGTTGA